MSDYGEGNYMEMVALLSPPPSPGLSEILAQLEQTDNGLNPTNDPLLQTNQSEQRPSLVDRVSARIGVKIPPLWTENVTPFAAQFRNATTVPLVNEIPPVFSPSVLLQSPSNFSYSSSQPIPPFSFPNDGPLEKLENSGDDHATTMIFNNDVPYQPMHFDLPPQEGSYVIPTENSADIPSHVDPIGAPLVASFESEVVEDESKSQDEDKEYREDEDTGTDEHADSADEQEVKPSSPKRRKYEVSDIMAATRTSKDPRVIVCVDTEEDNLDDGFRWRKYGQKVVKGNPNPRRYYKCADNGCNVKKHVERGANDVKILVFTYTGKHAHDVPATRSSSSSGPKNRSRSSLPARLDMPPFSSSSSSAFPNVSALAPEDKWPFPFSFALAPQNKSPFPCPSASGPQGNKPFPSSLNPGVDMTHGVSKLPSFPANQYNGFMGQNHGFINQNDESWVNQNHGFMVQNDEPVNQNHGFMDQNHGFMVQNDEPVNQNHGFKDQNHGFMVQNDEPVNQYHGFMDQNHGFMVQNDEPVNQNHRFMDQNHRFMVQNDEPVNQNHGVTGQNDEPRTDHVITDGSDFYREIMHRLFSN